MTVAAHTCVLEVHIAAVDSVFQPVCHDLKLHYLLAYRNVGFGDVDFHLGVVDLIGQAVSDDFREVPATKTIFFNVQKKELFSYLRCVWKPPPSALNCVDAILK